jgi:serine protease SohB
MLEVGIFAAKACIIFFAIAGLIIVVAVIAARAKHRPELSVEPLHKNLKELSFFLKSFTLDKEEMKQEKKKLKAHEKEQHKKDEQKKKAISKTNPATPQHEKRIFTLSFKGDVSASQVDNLREEITSILQLATPQDEVVAKIESPGGVVHGYGLAASQLLRLRERQIPLTVCVDKVAASGGYMMACVANQVIAAPFAILGSIGVIAQVPNVHRLLKKHDVDFKEYTAGEYKRTVTMLGEITAKGEQKFKEQLDDTHALFKEWVQANRPQVNLEQVATGEYWYGERAKTLGLIDSIQTSDEYLLDAYRAETPIYEIKYEKKKHLSEKFSFFLSSTVAGAVEKVTQAFEKRQYF